MNKFSGIIYLGILSTLLSCNNTDFSNPEEVVTRYRELTSKNENELIYEDFLSAKSKELVTSDEFVQSCNIEDSILSSIALLDRKVLSLPGDDNNASYRRFKVDERYVFKGDTAILRVYHTLINEDGKWKIIWTGSLETFAEKKFADGNYTEAKKVLEKIIEINPYSGSAYDRLAWIYNRDNSIPKEEREEGIVKNANYAIALEEDVSAHYNALANYYNISGNINLAIHNYEKALSYSLNESDKVQYYGNLSLSYLSKKEFEKAEEVIKKAIQIDESSAFNWMIYGKIYKAKRENARAKEYFEVALKKSKMEGTLQGDLYYSYSICCFDEGICGLAREYAYKALDISPDNKDYIDLLKYLENCKEGTKDGFQWYENLKLFAELFKNL
jgi:Tfp pilus assembly protein PilF